MENKVFLGGGVTVAGDLDAIVLTTEDRNRIVLEPDVWARLREYMFKRDAAKEKRLNALYSKDPVV